jgi:protoporphyrinogen oxidase
MINSLSYAVVGGGVLGLTLAGELAKAGHRVTVYESAPEFGGLASAWEFAGMTWDRHYHVTLLSDSHLRDTLKELGLDKKMKWVETRTGFYMNGKLTSMSNSVEFLKFPPLSLVDKLRLGMTIAYAARIKNWKRLEKIGVVDWLTRWSGKNVVEKMWLPLLRAKLGENYVHASAAFIWAIIARMYAARRSGLKKEMFGYLPGGYAVFFEAFTKRLKDAGVELCAGRSIAEVTSDPAGVKVQLADGETRSFDRVVLTVPSGPAAAMVPQLTAAERAVFDAVRYQGIICASVLLDRPLGGFYVTNLIDAWVPFTAVIEMSTLVDPAEFGGKHLAYLPKYVDPADPLFEKSDEEIRASFVDALKRMYPGLTEGNVLAFKVSRVRRVLAISGIDYSAKLPPMATSVPGVSIVNSAHIVNGTLNVNETIQLAKTAAGLLSGSA